MFLTLLCHKFHKVTYQATLVSTLCAIGISTMICGQQSVSVVDNSTVGMYCNQMRSFSTPESTQILNQYSAGNVADATRGALRVASGAAKAMGDRNQSNKQRIAASKAGIAGWSLAISVAATTMDMGIRAQVLKSWEEGLTDRYSAYCQLCALTSNFSRNFLTERFWKVFQDTNDAVIVRATCHLMAEHGSGEDIAALRKKAASIGDRSVRCDLETAIVYVKYHSQARRDFSIPAGAPPRMPSLEEILKSSS